MAASLHDLHASLGSKAQAFHPLLSSFAVEIILLVILFVVVIPLARFLFSLIQASYVSLSSPKLPSQTGLLKPSQLPHISPTLPYFGHLFGLSRDSARYANRLIGSMAAPIFTINIPFKQIIVANPSMDRNLSRHVSDTGLAQILAYVGPRVFSLGEKTIQVILDVDPRPLHKVEFGAPENLKALSDRSSMFLWDQMDRMPMVSELDLAHWMFKLTVSATASAVWGEKNPWRMDHEFSEEFMNLSETFDSLSRPFASITARPAWKSRKFLSQRLRAFHMQHRDSRVQSVAHAINVVAHSDPDWETNPDYFNIEMVSALGLLATPSTLSVWLMRHLLATPELLRVIVEEVKRVPVIHGETYGTTRLDLTDVKTLCPWLVAAWYETLRLHMTGVPRLARHNFTLALPGADPLAVTQGDIFLLPMCASNLDVANWGPDAKSFVPGRFILPNGEVSMSLTRKVKAFGVAGNLCPGRVFGTEVAMAVVAGTLKTFDIKSAEEKPFWVPGVRKGFNVGFERYADDVKVVMVKREKYGGSW